MRHVGRGRIVLWEGASLWAFDVPREATIRRSTDVHAHHAIQWTFSVGGSFVFRIAGEVVGGPSVLIAPDVLHAFEPQGRTAMVFVEPESMIGAAMLRDLAGSDFSHPDPARFADIAESLSCIWGQPRPDDATLAGMGRGLLSRIVGRELSAQTVDRRIARVLERLSSHPEARLDASEAAGIACLSESRFSHLFVEEVGLPFRTYLLWRRLMAAVDRIAAGTSLTDAAHDAGFADSAHFSRTFLRMFGVPASLLVLT